jgi:holo-[acyl-carrier protein] synthase
MVRAGAEQRAGCDEEKEMEKVAHAPIYRAAASLAKRGMLRPARKGVRPAASSRYTSTVTILGLGTDILEIARFQSSIERHGRAFIERIFLPGEQAYCDPHREPARSYAARFAAKEAVAKALGTGIGAQLGLLDIEVRRRATGQPFIVLHGTGAETAARLGVRELHVTLSHSEHYATATVIATGD